MIRGISSLNPSDSSSSSSGVCIFESFPPIPPSPSHTLDSSSHPLKNIPPSSSLKGLLRLLPTGPSTIYGNASLSGLPPKTTSSLWIHESGDISDGLLSLGKRILFLGDFKTNDFGIGKWSGELKTSKENFESLIGRGVSSSGPGHEFFGILAR